MIELSRNYHKMGEIKMSYCGCNGHEVIAGSKMRVLNISRIIASEYLIRGRTTGAFLPLASRRWVRGPGPSLKKSFYVYNKYFRLPFIYNKLDKNKLYFLYPIYECRENKMS